MESRLKTTLIFDDELANYIVITSRLKGKKYWTRVFSQVKDTGEVLLLWEKEFYSLNPIFSHFRAINKWK